MMGTVERSTPSGGENSNSIFILTSLCASRPIRAFSSQVNTGLRRENATNQNPRACSRFNWSGKSSRTFQVAYGVQTPFERQLANVDTDSVHRIYVGADYWEDRPHDGMVGLSLRRTARRRSHYPCAIKAERMKAVAKFIRISVRSGLPVLYRPSPTSRRAFQETSLAPIPVLSALSQRCQAGTRLRKGDSNADQSEPKSRR